MPRALSAVTNTDPVFDETVVPINGIDYHLRELTAGEYDTCLEAATKESGDVDMVFMVKLMLIKSITDPPLKDTDLARLPYKVSRRLKQEVQRLHWSDEQEAVSKAADEAEEEETAAPNR